MSCLSEIVIKCRQYLSQSCVLNLAVASHFAGVGFCEVFALECRKNVFSHPETRNDGQTVRLFFKYVCNFGVLDGASDDPEMSAEYERNVVRSESLTFEAEFMRLDKLHVMRDDGIQCNARAVLFYSGRGFDLIGQIVDYFFRLVYIAVVQT